MFAAASDSNPSLLLRFLFPGDRRNLSFASEFSLHAGNYTGRSMRSNTGSEMSDARYVVNVMVLLYFLLVIITADLCFFLCLSFLPVPCQSVLESCRTVVGPNGRMN